MSMRDIHLGIRLPFETSEDQEDSEDILMWLLGIMCRLNLHHLRKYPETPLLYDSDVVYTPPDQCDGRPPISRGDMRKLLAMLRSMGCSPETALMVVRLIKGIEIFLDIPALYRRGKGDCNELAPVRVAELWRAGVPASPYLVKEKNDRGGWTYHALVKHPDDSSEDPSLILGMGGPDREADRKEEIRKNGERWMKCLSAARELVSTAGASPEALGRQIDLMGLVPRNLVFKSPRLLAEAAGVNLDERVAA